MSGGHYGYIDRNFSYFAESLEKDVKAEEDPRIRERMDLILRLAKLTGDLAHELDLMLSSDTGPDTFQERTFDILKYSGLEVYPVAYQVPDNSALMSIEDFRSHVLNGAIIHEDGEGFFCYPQGTDRSTPVKLAGKKTFYPSEATHVEWYNR
jgi:hypothetical protein